MPNGNMNELVVVWRTSDGNLFNRIASVIPNLTTMGNQLWAIGFGLRRAHVKGPLTVIIETDNMEAFGSIKFTYLNQRRLDSTNYHQD